MKPLHFDPPCGDPQCTHCRDSGWRQQQTAVSRSALAGWDQAVVTLNERRKELGFVRTIAVDFDGVIHQYSQGWQDGSIYDPPMPGAREGLVALMSEYAVYVHTTRDPEMTARWMARWLMLPTAYEREGELGSVFVAVTANDRGGVDEHMVYRDPVEFWNDQERLLVSNRKLPAYVYVDDRAYRFTSWAYALPALLSDVGAP